MWVRKLPLLWVWLLLSLPLYGEVTEQERQQALEALTKVELYTKALQENSALRESFLNETEQALVPRETNLLARENAFQQKEAQLQQKEDSLRNRETSLQMTMQLTEESKRLYEKAEKRLKATSFWLKVGAIGAGVLGFLLGRI